MRVYEHGMKVGIMRTPEFEKKRLAQYAVNVGLKCGHGCEYCSSSSLLRTHQAFRQIGKSPFKGGYAIVDPATPERVAQDAKRIKNRGMIQLCTYSDAWAPEYQACSLGRRCLEAILAEPGWSVRILTQNAAVRKEFDLIHRYRDRVLVGLSITSTNDQAGLMTVLEPNASCMLERMVTLVEARALGLRTYGMFCPLLPGIADAPGQINRLVQFATGVGAEEVFVEPVNARGPNLKNCQKRLAAAGYRTEAAALERIRSAEGWSEYVLSLVKNVQASMRRYSDVAKLRILLNPLRLASEHRREIQRDDAGVIWLGKTSFHGSVSGLQWPATWGVRPDARPDQRELVLGDLPHYGHRPGPFMACEQSCQGTCCVRLLQEYD